jgi:tape measure domain-containing protein
MINVSVQGQSALNKIIALTTQFEEKVRASGGKVDVLGTKLTTMGQRGKAAFDSMKTSVSGWLAGLGIAAATLGALNTTANISSLDTAIKFAGGAEGAANLAHVEATAARLNTPLMAAKEGHKILSGSMMGTNITALQQRDIFDSVAVASRVMGLSADNTTGAILALGQMASKGKVQAEELRGQLGERLPGAFAIAARAMGVSTRELDKMMEQGKLVSEDFLPKFAAELERTFGPGLEAAMNTPRAQFDKFGNSILTLKELIGTELMPTATALINDVFVPMVGLVGQNIQTIVALAKIVGIWIGLTKTAVLWQGLWTMATKSAAASQLLFAGSLGRAILISKISALVTGGLTGAVSALNAAFWANPIMWVVGILATLVIAVRHAWNHFEGFRGFLFGMWAVIKETGAIIYDYMIAPLEGFSKAIIGFFSRDLTMMREGINEGIRAINKNISGPSISDRIGQSFTDGWNKGVANFNQDNSGDKLAASSNTPGGALANTKFGQPGSPSATNGEKKASKIADGITGGGQRNVTINVGKLNEGGITIHTTNLKEGSTEVEAMLMKLMLQVINSGNQQQGK